MAESLNITKKLLIVIIKKSIIDKLQLFTKNSNFRTIFIIISKVNKNLEFLNISETFPKFRTVYNFGRHPIYPLSFVNLDDRQRRYGGL